MVVNKYREPCLVSLQGPLNLLRLWTIFEVIQHLRLATPGEKVKLEIHQHQYNKSTINDY